jgi:hypothetical protein
MHQQISGLQCCRLCNTICLRGEEGPDSEAQMAVVKRLTVVESGAQEAADETPTALSGSDESTKADPEIEEAAEPEAETQLPAGKGLSPPARFHRKRGRPPKVRPESPDSPTPQSNFGPPIPRNIPKPPWKNFGSHQPTGHRVNDFFAYWVALPEWAQSQVDVYIYRIMPVIQRYDPRRAKFTIQQDPDGKLNGVADVIGSEEEFVAKYGCGDYLLKLNDQVGWKGTVAECSIEAGRDYEAHPPRINLERLVLSEPNNEKYIMYLRSKGIRLPGDAALREGEEEEEMAQQGEAIKQLTEALVDQSQRVAELSERRMGEPAPTPAAPAAPPTPAAALEAEANRSGQEIIQSYTKLGQKVLSEAVTSASELSGRQADPAAMIKSMAELLAAVAAIKQGGETGKTDGATEKLVQGLMTQIGSLQEQIHKMEMDQMAALRAEMQELRKQPAVAVSAPAVAPPAAPRTDFLSFLKEYRDVKRFLGEGGAATEESAALGNVAPNPEDPLWLRYMPYIMQGLNVIGTLVATGLHNAAVAKTGVGEVINPQEALARAQAETAQLQAQIESGQVPALQPGGEPQAQPGTQPQEGAAELNIGAVIMAVEGPLRLSLDRGEDGHDFAAKVIDTWGDVAYGAAKSFGRDAWVQALAARPGLAVIVGTERFSQFLDEFLGYDQWLAEQQRQEQERKRPKIVVRPPEARPVAKKPEAREESPAAPPSAA